MGGGGWIGEKEGALGTTGRRKGEPPNQGGERLGGETSGSERKGVMQWTGGELISETKRKLYAAKFGDLMDLKEEFSIHALLLFITRRCFGVGSRSRRLVLLDEIPGVQD